MLSSRHLCEFAAVAVQQRARPKMGCRSLRSSRRLLLDLRWRVKISVYSAAWCRSVRRRAAASTALPEPRLPNALVFLQSAQAGRVRLAREESRPQGPAHFADIEVA